MSGDRRASARPRRLLNFAETVQAVKEALQRRAGYLEDAWDAYDGPNAGEWRVDFGELPGALRAWAGTLGSIGDWTGQVGQAFLDADSDDPGGVHRLRESRLRRLLPEDARELLEESDAEGYVDWGDPDDPPAWLEDLRSTGTAISRVGESADTLKVSFIVGRGARARWSPMTPELLGRFATPTQLARFAAVLNAGAAGLGGLHAGLEQWLTDSQSLNYTSGEAAARATARGAGMAGSIAAGGAIGSGLATAFCVPGVGVCAGTVIIFTGVAATGAGDWVLDRLLSEPGPAEHDPDLVYDEILGLQPGHLPRDVPDATWEVLEHVESAGEAVEPDLAERHPFLDRTGFDPAMVEQYDLPLPWIAEQHGDWTAFWAASYREANMQTTAPLLNPQAQAAIDRYESELSP